jgi:hypothetical protein
LILQPIIDQLCFYYFLIPFFPLASPGRPGGTRTPNLRFWRPLLYQLSYWPNTNAKRKALDQTKAFLVCFPAYSIIFETTPAPTVLPPSRIAKRKPSSIAIGAISSTFIFMLSPGITISVPSGISQAPVTSVVLK